MKKTVYGVRGRTVLFFLAVAALIAVLAILPIVGSADPAPGEIEDFGYQTVSADSLESGETSLRFIFTVGSLDYTRVGFVFSKTNENPTIGGSGCYVHQTTSVHTEIWANGSPLRASDGRFWVAVKMSHIPNASFSTPTYIRPFVQDGEGIRYASAVDLSVCAAYGHDNPELGKILVPPTNGNPGKRECHCARCGDVVTSVDLAAYNAEVAQYQSLAAGFSNSDFASGSVTANLGNGTSYNALTKNPTKGQHPRVMFNESDIAGIRTALSNAPSAVTEAYDVAVFTDPTDGEIGPADPERTDGTHNFDAGRMNKIQLLALDYQLTGNKISGYHAIYALKNYLKLMDFQEITGDQCRQFGYVMSARTIRASGWRSASRLRGRTPFRDTVANSRSCATTCRLPSRSTTIIPAGGTISPTACIRSTFPSAIRGTRRGWCRRAPLSTFASASPPTSSRRCS